VECELLDLLVLGVGELDLLVVHLYNVALAGLALVEGTHTDYYFYVVAHLWIGYN
jgi:hypothetical protein